MSAILTFSQKETSLKEKIALIKVEGPIIQSKSVVDELKEHTKNNQIKAIVLRIESPGGGVVPSQEIYDAVKKTSKTKKIIVSMGAVAASGGYYIAAPATRIVANPGTITGSIGVIMEIPNVQGLMDKIGIKTEIIKSGKYKDMTSVSKGIGKEQRAILQGLLDDVHEQFIKAVAEGRKMPVEKVRELADGSVFSGVQALDKGLIDELGSLENAVKIAANLAGIKGEPEVITKKNRHYLLDLFENRIYNYLSGSFSSYELKYLFLP
ncbi:MAG TPA: signal peptide peptidase SppA [Nitrospirae bacterium]|nr:signal peptide peptidase SppA [Nitrospirota bacterium]